MNENRIAKTASMQGRISTRVPKEVEDTIRERAESMDRPVAYIVRKTLMKEFGKKK